MRGISIGTKMHENRSRLIALAHWEVTIIPVTNHSKLAACADGGNDHTFPQVKHL